MQEISKRLLNWASIIAPTTQPQAEVTSTMPFIYPHLALMPDCHLGKGATVGSVIPTLGAIIPAAVGVDIGCGMMALRTEVTEHQLVERGGLADLHGGIAGAVPLVAGKKNDGRTAITPWPWSTTWSTRPRSSGWTRTATPRTGACNSGA